MSDPVQDAAQHQEDLGNFAYCMAKYILNIHPQMFTANMGSVQGLYWRLKADIERAQNEMETIVNAERRAEGNPKVFHCQTEMDSYWEERND